MIAGSRIVRPLVLAWLGIDGLTAAAAAETFVVDSFLDQIDDDLIDVNCHTAANTCTLRAAVMQASVNPSDTTIELPAGTYLLTRLPSGGNGPDNGDLNLVKPGGQITLRGAGAGTTIIDGNGLDRVLHLESGTLARIADVSLRGGMAVKGGGILVEGALQMFGARVTANEATQDGGGLYIDSIEEALIVFSQVTGNQAAGNGGGLYVDHSPGAGSVTIAASAIRGNTAATYGGGLYFFSPTTLTIDSTTIEGNTAKGAGGASFAESGATVELIASTVSGNRATDPVEGFGGGIVSGATLYVTNSTISGNFATLHGGGIYSSGNTSLYNTTVVFNEADSDADPNGGLGGGVYNEVGYTFAIRNSVLAGNFRAASPTASDCTGVVAAYGHNRFGSFSGCTVSHGGVCGGTDLLLGSLAQLGPLRANGGYTPTHEIQAGSVLIDDVDSPCICQDRFGQPIETDQRGGPRVVGARCDPGAFEHGALPTGSIFADDFEIGSSWRWL